MTAVLKNKMMMDDHNHDNTHEENNGDCDESYSALH